MPWSLCKKKNSGSLTIRKSISATIFVFQAIQTKLIFVWLAEASIVWKRRQYWRECKIFSQFWRRPDIHPVRGRGGHIRRDWGWLSAWMKDLSWWSNLKLFVHWSSLLSVFQTIKKNNIVCATTKHKNRSQCKTSLKYKASLAWPDSHTCTLDFRREVCLSHFHYYCAMEWFEVPYSPPVHTMACSRSTQTLSKRCWHDSNLNRWLFLAECVCHTWLMHWGSYLYVS